MTMLRKLLPLLWLWAIGCLPVLLTAQQPFTPADDLNVAGLRNTTISPNGRFVAAIRNFSTRNRLNVDHFQYGNPNYIRPFSGMPVLYDLEKGGQKDLLEQEAHVISPTWSGDSRRLAFWIYDGTEFRLHVFDTRSNRLQKVDLKLPEGHSIASITPLEWLEGDDRLLISLRSPEWSGKGAEMFREATDGPVIEYDASQPFLKWDAIRLHDQRHVPAIADLSDGMVEPLLPEGLYSNFRVGADHLTYVKEEALKTSYNRRDGSRYALYRLDLTGSEGPVELIAPAFNRLNLEWTVANDWFAWADSGHVMIQHVRDTLALNLTRGHEYLVEDGDSTRVRFSPEKWSPDATQLIARSSQGLWKIDRTTGEVERFWEFPEDEAQRPRLGVHHWSPSGRFLYLTFSAPDRWERGMLRYDFQEEQPADLIRDDRLYSQWQTSRNGSRIIFERSDGNRPAELYAADPDFQSVAGLSNLNPWIADRKMTRTELIDYLDADGKKLYGILYYPVDYDPAKKYPLVCEIYERFFDNGYRASMNIIANQGYFGFRPSVEFEEGYPGEAWLKGVTAGINKLIERGLVDPEKIGVHGTSYGGYATSLLIAQTDRFAAAINISGKTNIISFLGDSPRIGTRNYAAAEVGQDRIGETLWEAPMKYINTSAVFFADRMNTPHLLLTGEGDWNVPAANTRELYYALRRLGKKVQWVNYRNAGHGGGWAGTEADYFDQWERILGWYARHFSKEEQQAKP